MGFLAEWLAKNDTNFRSARLPALYADFEAQRSVNPDGYQANVRVWRQAITHATWAGMASSGTTEMTVANIDHRLLASLEHELYGRPLAFDAVIRDSVLDGHLIPLSVFLYSQHSIFQTPWKELPWALVQWTARWLGLGGISLTTPVPSKGQFVALDNVTKAADIIMALVPDAQSPFERLFTRKHFEKTFAPMAVPGRLLTPVDFDVLLAFMSRDKQVICYDGQIIKFKLDRNIPEGDGPHITDEDYAIASLKELIRDLRIQAERGSVHIEELTASAKANVSRGNTIAAKAVLRSRKLSQTTLEQRLATLAHLEQVAAKMEQASDQAQLIDVLSTSSNLLRSINVKIGGVEKVEEVMQQLRDQMTEVDEVGNIITADATAAVDESLLDEELHNLAAQEYRPELTPTQKDPVEDTELERRIAEMQSTPQHPLELDEDAIGLAPEVTDGAYKQRQMEASNSNTGTRVQLMG